jgi:hypothetical protein
MSLLEKCINTINKRKDKIKKINLPQKILDKFNNNINTYEISKVLEKYYNKHTSLREYSQMKEQELDKLPIIKFKGNTSYIRFFDINGSYVDYSKDPKKYKTYDTGSKYGNRIIKIVKMTQKAINKNENMIIDFSECHGGDIAVYFDAFKDLVGTGLMFYYDEKNTHAYCYYDGNKYFCTKTPKKIKRIKPSENKNITIIVSHDSSSSAEYITMIIKNSYPKTKIIGHSTAGYLNLPNNVTFKYKNTQYVLNYTIALTAYDSDDKKYYGYINVKTEK